MARRLSLFLALLSLIAAVAVQPAPAAADELIAPPGTCPGQEAADAPAATQERAMLCMTEYARSAAGLPPVADASSLDWSAAAKAADILRCDSFSHFACGRDYTYWMREAGYLNARCWRAAENLAFASRRQATVESVFAFLMGSPPHRHNILGRYEQIGIGLRTGSLAGRAGISVWTQHFGSHCLSGRAGRRSGKI